MLTQIYCRFNATLSKIGYIFFWYDLRVRLYTNKYTKNNCSTIPENNNIKYKRANNLICPTCSTKPANTLSQATIGPPAKRRWDGVSLAGRCMLTGEMRLNPWYWDCLTISSVKYCNVTLSCSGAATGLRVILHCLVD